MTEREYAPANNEAHVKRSVGSKGRAKIAASKKFPFRAESRQVSRSVFMRLMRPTISASWITS
jgi:hypothetical protein